MAWAFFLLQQLLLAESQSLLQVDGQLRRTQQLNPHAAAWFHALEAEPDEVLQVEHPHPRLRPQRQHALSALSATQEKESLKIAGTAKATLKVEHGTEMGKDKMLDQDVMMPLKSVQATTEPEKRGPHTERAVYGNLTCSQPGCAANATLQLYDPGTEYVQDCSLSLAVHATDFDDNFAGERIANFLANGRAMGGDCYPLVNGCVSKSSRELLYSCISDLPVDTIISTKGRIRVQAEIPRNVDECPYGGNLLHGVTTVRCSVGKLADLTTTTSTTTTSSTSKWLASARTPPHELGFVKKWLAEHPGKTIEDMPGYDSFYNMSDRMSSAEPSSIASLEYYGSSKSYLETQLGSGTKVTIKSKSRPVFPFQRPKELSTQGALRCAEKGCSTSLVLDFNRTLVSINRCVAQLWLNQTDFDNLDGAVEVLSVNVAGKEVLSHAKPGANPCRSAYSGSPLSFQDIRYLALKDLDITQAIRDGPVNISAQISEQVDECPSNGYLLDSSLEVSCNISTIGALLEADQVSVADVFDLKKELLDSSDEAQRDKAFKNFLDVAAASTEPSEAKSLK